MKPSNGAASRLANGRPPENESPLARILSARRERMTRVYFNGSRVSYRHVQILLALPCLAALHASLYGHQTRRRGRASQPDGPRLSGSQRASLSRDLRRLRRLGLVERYLLTAHGRAIVDCLRAGHLFVSLLVRGDEVVNLAKR